MWGTVGPSTGNWSTPLIYTHTQIRTERRLMNMQMGIADLGLGLGFEFGVGYVYGVSVRFGLVWFVCRRWRLNPKAAQSALDTIQISTGV